MLTKKEKIVLMLMSTCILCAACGDKRVDDKGVYDKSTNADAVYAEDATMVGINEAFKEGDFNVKIDARAKLPEEGVSTYTAVAKCMDKNDREEIIKALSKDSNGKVYSGNDEDLPKAAVEYKLKAMGVYDKPDTYAPEYLQELKNIIWAI